MFFPAAYLLNTRGYPILWLKLDIQYLWWPVTLGRHSWNMFSRFGCGCVGHLELLAYAVVRGILMLIAIYTPLSEVKKACSSKHILYYEENIWKSSTLKIRGSMFLRNVCIDVALVCGRTQYEFWMLGCVLCQMVKRARRWCYILSDFHLFLAQNNAFSEHRRV